MAVKPEAKRDEKCRVFSYEDLQSMHYLHASIFESMRLYQLVLLDTKHALHNNVLPERNILCKFPQVIYFPYAMGHRDAI